jgi:hypothetical protein
VVTPLRAVIVLAIVGVAGWRLGLRLWTRRSQAAARAPHIAAPIPAAARGPAVPGAPVAQAAGPPPGGALPAVAPSAPPLAVEETPDPARAQLEAAEIHADVTALGPAFTQGTADFERLRGEITQALANPGGAATLREHPFRIQQVGSDVDGLPVRSVAVRAFQTRFTRILYDASRLAADVVRTARTPGAKDLPARREALDKIGQSLTAFQTDWTAFARQH